MQGPPLVELDDVRAQDVSRVRDPRQLEDVDGDLPEVTVPRERGDGLGLIAGRLRAGGLPGLPEFGGWQLALVLGLSVVIGLPHGAPFPRTPALPSAAR